MNLFPNSKTKCALIVFCLALFARIFVVLIQYKFNFLSGRLVGSDTKLYLDIAQNLLSGNGFATDAGATAFVSPLFPVFLAFGKLIFGENLIFVNLLQCVMGAFVCLLIFAYTNIIFENLKTAFIAGIIAAIHFELILWATMQLLTEPLYVFFLAIALYFLISGVKIEKRKTLNFCLSGIFFALASLTRPISIAIACGLAVVLFVSAVFGKTLDWKLPVYFIAVFFLLMMPWGIRNYFVMNSFTISSLEGGHVFWLGNNAEYDKYEHPDFTKYGGYTVMFKRPEETSGTEAESNRKFYELAQKHIFENPFEFIKRGFHKTWNMWRPNFSGSSWRNSILSYTFYPLILPASLIGMFFGWKSIEGNFWQRLGDPVSLFIAFFLFHLTIHAVITGEIRFRLPIWLVLIPFSAFAFSLIINKFQSRFSDPQ